MIYSLFFCVAFIVKVCSVYPRVIARLLPPDNIITLDTHYTRMHELHGGIKVWESSSFTVAQFVHSIVSGFIIYSSDL